MSYRPYQITSIGAVAFASGKYLGELPIVPNTLSHLIKRGLGLPLSMPFMVYYYGDLDQLVAEKFGYEWPPRSNKLIKKEERAKKQERRTRQMEREAQVRAARRIAKQVERGVETGEEVKIGD